MKSLIHTAHVHTGHGHAQILTHAGGIRNMQWVLCSLPCANFVSFNDLIHGWRNEYREWATRLHAPHCECACLATHFINKHKRSDNVILSLCAWVSVLQFNKHSVHAHMIYKDDSFSLSLFCLFLCIVPPIEHIRQVDTLWNCANTQCVCLCWWHCAYLCLCVACVSSSVCLAVNQHNHTRH